MLQFIVGSVFGAGFAGAGKGKDKPGKGKDPKGTKGPKRKSQTRQEN